MTRTYKYIKIEQIWHCNLEKKTKAISVITRRRAITIFRASTLAPHNLIRHYSKPRTLKEWVTDPTL